MSDVPRIRIGFVLHAMDVAGAEVLVSEIIDRCQERLNPVIFCLDRIGALGERLIAEGIEVICLNRRPGWDWLLPQRLAHECRRLSISILHAHQYTPYFYSAAARLVGRLNMRIALTEHGRHYPDIVSQRRRLANRWLLASQADAINACCRFSATALAQNDGFPEDRIDVIRNGICLDRYNPRADCRSAKRAVGLNPERRHIGTIARFHPVKDHATLLLAFRKIAVEASDVDLVLAGDGPLRGELEARVAEYGLTERVSFLGVRRDIPQLLPALEAFVLPSLSEAASLTMLEAMACGLPVVATNVGGNPEIITSKVHGLLVPRADAEELAGAVLFLLNSPNVAVGLGDAARRRVLKEYRLEDTVSAHLAVYERLLCRTSHT